MKTQIKKLGDTTVIAVDGKIDYEVQEPFKKNLLQFAQETAKDSTAKKIVFDLEGLEFVGSSGISNFIQTLKDFSTKLPERPRYCNVRSEFKKVMKALDEGQQFEFYDNLDRAKKSFDQ